MNNKRPPAKKISRDAVVKDCDAILSMSVIFAVLGAALYWGLLDTLAPVICPSDRWVRDWRLFNGIRFARGCRCGRPSGCSGRWLANPIDPVHEFDFVAPPATGDYVDGFCNDSPRTNAQP